VIFGGGGGVVASAPVPSAIGAGLTGDPDADLEGSLAEWQKFRRKKRLEEVHWVDALYQAYLTAILAGAAILIGAGAVGDTPITDGRDVLVHGPRWVGAGAAALVAMGLRSGARGGPLALERADVRHVLLAPVDRTTALRGPALRQVRFLAFVGIVVGLVVGVLADRRLPGNGPAWAACGGLAVLTAVVLAWGAACIASGLRLPQWAAGLIGLGLVGWSVGDAASDGGVWSPGRLVGGIVFWPLHFDAVDVAAVAVAALAVVAGIRLIGGVSIERLERRSRLVGQVRFAATLQDVRTVLVLRRQLAQERPRNKPWIRLPLPRQSFPIVVRDIRSLLRWPLSRAIRLLLLAAVAGLAARGAWNGTTPLVVVEGLAFFLVGLDAAEPLGQELDHPSRRDSVPVPVGWIYVRHLPAILTVSLGVAFVAAAVAVLVDPVPGAWSIATACVLPAALGATCGAVVNLVSGAVDTAVSASGASAWSLAPPEAAGMRILFRTAWPPALAIIGTTPLLAARNVYEKGTGDVSAAGQGASGLLLVIFVLVAGWLRQREDIKAWWRKQSEMQKSTMRGETPGEGTR
jgi:hypothetical protein